MFGLSAPIIVGAVAIRAYLRSFDVTETVGFLWMHLGEMFFSWLVFGVFLNGVAVAKVLGGRQHIAKPAPATVRVVCSIAVVVLVGCAAAFAVVLWRPRWWSIGMGFAIMGASFFLSGRLARRGGFDEQALIDAQDKFLKVNDDEDHKWYGI